MNRPVSLLNCFLFPIIVLIVGVILSGFYAFQTIPETFADDNRGVVPPKLTVSLDQPGKYSLWIYSVGNFEGQTYEIGEKLPTGARIHVIDGATGDFLPLDGLIKQNKSLRGQSAFLIGTFQTGIPNQEVQVIASGIGAKAVVGISSKNMSDMINVYIAIFGIFIISLFLAISLLVLMLHHRKKQILEQPVSDR